MCHQSVETYLVNKLLMAWSKEVDMNMFWTSYNNVFASTEKMEAHMAGAAACK